MIYSSRKAVFHGVFAVFFSFVVVCRMNFLSGFRNVQRNRHFGSPLFPARQDSDKWKRSANSRFTSSKLVCFCHEFEQIFSESVLCAIKGSKS